MHKKGKKCTIAGLRPRRKVDGELYLRPTTPEVKSDGRNVLHAPAREGEFLEMQLPVAALEWTTTRDLIAGG